MSFCWADTAGDDQAASEAERDRLNEAHRERRWQEFQAWCEGELRDAAACGWSDMPHVPLFYDVARVSRWDAETEIAPDDRLLPLRDFAEAEGWPAVLRVIARALAETER